MKNRLGHELPREFETFIDIAKEKKVYADITAEYLKARDIYNSFHSAHEGYAVIKEEVDELWSEVKKKDRHRSMHRMKKECIQIAAMAIRFIYDVCEGGK